MVVSKNPPHVVLTGAAGALGRAVAQHFLDAGARLAFIEHHAGHLAEAFPGLDNSRHLLVEADVTSASSVGDAAAKILQSLRHVDVLVHMAGGFEMGSPVHLLDRAAWDRMMDLNAWSFVTVAQAFAPSMIERRAGRVIAVSAKSAARGMAAQGAYIAAKSALQRLVETMAAELAPHAITVNSIVPNILDTPANRAAMPDANPSGWVPPHVAASVIAFLASDAAVALHGQHLTLDA